MSHRALTVRLDTDYKDEKSAWEKLGRLHRSTHLSYSRIIVTALNAYEAESLHLAQEDEERLTRRIADAVTERLEQMLPVYLSGYIAGKTAFPAASTPVETREVPSPTTANDNAEYEIEPDFSDSVMDFDFICN